MYNLQLSRRAAFDVQYIESYSIEKWGKKVAEEYLQSIEDALNLILENPTLLRSNPEVSDSLCFYRVRQHFLVCAIFEKIILVLTVKHGAIDLPNRIAEIEPLLSQEADMLYQAYRKKVKDVNGYTG